jgi:type 2 lantibiotic biosynthesis protein LanM
MHSDNLIAAGEHPILVDLETLFQPAVEQFDLRESDAAARAWLASSVLATGLLPLPMWETATSEGVDISALGGAPAASTPRPDDAGGQPAVALPYSLRPTATLHTKNRPKLNGRDVDPAGYRDEVIAGFVNVYEMLVRHGDPFLADDGPVAAFAGDEVRLLLRPTQAYATLLERSRNPHLLRNAIHQDCLFDWLWSKLDEHPYLERVIPAEQEDLRRGDIPLFTTTPGSRDLWTSSGRRIAEFVAEPALDLVRRRIRRAGHAERERQTWAIRAAFAALPQSAGRRPARRKVAEPALPATRGELLFAARAIGDRLEDLALRGADDACWLGLGATDGRPPSVISLGADLYSGVPGIALFLAYARGPNGWRPAFSATRRWRAGGVAFPSASKRPA